MTVGLGMSATAEVMGRGLLRRRPSRDALFASIRSEIEGFIDNDLLRQLLSFTIEAHELRVGLHPAGEHVYFKWDPSHTLRVTVKTSNAGPGYHDCVCGLLDHLAQKCGFQWHVEDDGNYFQERDTAKLQNEMAKFLAFLGTQSQTDLKDCSLIALNWPILVPMPEIPKTVISPNGIGSPEWWDRLRDAQGEDRLELAREFFPWWSIGRDAEFWKGLGTVMLWNDVHWHPPINPDEEETCRRALACFDRARQLNAAVALPQIEIDELKQLLEGDPSEVVPPDLTGVGFYRGAMRFQTTGDWSVVLPGYFYHEFENNGETAVFWFGDRTVRISSFSFKFNNPKTLDEILDQPPDNIVYEHGPTPYMKGWATIERSSEDGHDFWMFSGKLACSTTLCYVSVCYDHEDDKQWAIDVFKSVTHPQLSDES